MKSVKIVGLDFNGIKPKTENAIPTEVNDLTDASTIVKKSELGYNLEINNNVITVREASETIAGGIYYWKDENGYWHLTTTDADAEIEYIDNLTGQTAIVETRQYTIQENATGQTAIV